MSHDAEEGNVQRHTIVNILDGSRRFSDFFQNIGLGNAIRIINGFQMISGMTLFQGFDFVIRCKRHITGIAERNCVDIRNGVLV